MKFTEVIDGLGQGLAFSRKKWEFLRIGDLATSYIPTWEDIFADDWEEVVL